MKQSQSNPLLKELARGYQAGVHPDADTLTAFAEGTLLQREKQELLAHLASCADCREILGVAAACAPAPASGPAAVRLLPARRTRTWVPWAGTATALAVLVASVSILLYQQRGAHQNAPTIAKDTVTQAPPLMATPRQQSAPPPAKQKAEARRDELDRPMKKAEAAPAAAPPPTAAAIPQSSESVSVESPQEPSQQVQSTDALQNQLAGQSDGRNQQQAVGGQVSENAIQQANNAQLDLENNKTATQREANQATGAKPTNRSSAAFVQLEPQREMAKAAGLARPHWRINAAGQPERSFGNGVWQAVLPLETSRMRVISVFQDQVWVGGDHTRLYRSGNNGAIWTLVSLPVKGGADHAIAHIRFVAPATVTVEATDGVSWTSLDSGLTWK